VAGYCEANGGANAWYFSVKPVTATGSDLTRCLEYYSMTHLNTLYLDLNYYIKKYIPCHRLRRRSVLYKLSASACVSEENGLKRWRFLRRISVEYRGYVPEHAGFSRTFSECPLILSDFF